MKPIPNSRAQLLFNYWCERKVFKKRRLSFAKFKDLANANKVPGLELPGHEAEEKEDL